MKPQLTTHLSNVVRWLMEHPHVVRIAVVILPIAITLAAALFTRGLVYACPPSIGGSGGCH